VVAIGWPILWNSDPAWLAFTPVRVVLGTLWVYVVCALAIKELYRISWGRALLHTFIGIAVGGGFSGIFIR